MEKKTKNELVDIIKKSIDFKNKNQGILSVISKNKDEEVIITSEDKINDLLFEVGDILKICLYFLDREDRMKEFEVTAK